MRPLPSDRKGEIPPGHPGLEVRHSTVRVADWARPANEPLMMEVVRLSDQLAAPQLALNDSFGSTLDARRAGT
jgi:hypothetical protein